MKSSLVIIGNVAKYIYRTVIKPCYPLNHNNHHYYTRFLPDTSFVGDQVRLTDRQRGGLQQDLSVFAAALGAEVHELRRSEANFVDRLSHSAASHRVEVTSYLAEVRRFHSILLHIHILPPLLS